MGGLVRRISSRLQNMGIEVETEDGQVVEISAMDSIDEMGLILCNGCCCWNDACYCDGGCCGCSGKWELCCCGMSGCCKCGTEPMTCIPPENYCCQWGCCCWACGCKNQ